MRYYYKRNRFFNLKTILFLLISISIIVLVFLFFSNLFDPEKKAARALELFYSYEQAGDYSNSWELFHSQMKDKFEKNYYIQERTYMYKENLGVSTFDFNYNIVEELPKWRMSQESGEIMKVYHYTVSQSFQGKYGTFTIQQPVYVTMEGEKWVILWNYN
ncbi:hypothetical protein F9U64_13730 [Gracilibacillus oryzae]|uniref:NTF2-like N-terminal transpeptidase domain-containing protein n=1 Tax=Gracilibacillus oryzae TaxID=1672701 RepID=A0A7C8KPF6_9BACI|nr:hypothetical protein [Gracilibacillus oryzae]KAB8131034.1 hypothetical protein F9U64_13730 [Gracilibacillus oryzae]